MKLQILFLILLIFCSIIMFKKSLWALNPYMKIKRIDNCLIIDDFYLFPKEVRKYALNHTFIPHTTLYKTMYFDPGCNYSKFNLKQLESIEGKRINKKIWNYNNIHESNGFFQYLTKNDKPTIHTDGNLRTMIVYLHPNPKLNSGTSLFEHKSSKIFKKTYENSKRVKSDLTNKSAWKKYVHFENKFNRAIIFDGNCYHASDGGFGTDKYDSRLYQTFFYTFT